MKNKKISNFFPGIPFLNLYNFLGVYAWYRLSNPEILDAESTIEMADIIGSVSPNYDSFFSKFITFFLFAKKFVGHRFSSPIPFISTLRWGEARLFHETEWRSLCWLNQAHNLARTKKYGPVCWSQQVGGRKLVNLIGGSWTCDENPLSPFLFLKIWFV